MFDWRSLEDAGNARKPADATPYTGSRVVDPAEITSSTSVHELTKRLHDVGYTNKTVTDALDRFLVHHFSGSRYKKARLTSSTAIKTSPPLPNSAGASAPKSAKAARPAKEIVQEVADLIDQVYRDK